MPKVFFSRTQVGYFAIVVICVASMFYMGLVAFSHGKPSIMIQCFGLVIVSILTFGLLARIFGILQIPTFSSDCSTWVSIRTRDGVISLTRTSKFEIVSVDRGLLISADGLTALLTPDCSGYSSLIPLLKDWKATDDREKVNSSGRFGSEL